MTKNKNPDIVQTRDGFKRRGTGDPAPNEFEDNEFYRCYKIIHGWSMETVQQQLWKLGRWPYERIAVRVLGWEEAVTRLTKDIPSMLAMTRMVVVIEDLNGKLYLVRSPDLVSGVPAVHRQMREDNVQAAIDEVTR